MNKENKSSSDYKNIMEEIKVAMAILFRKEQEKSPFAEALKKLIDSGEGKLILSSGYFAYRTKLIDWIVNAASINKINEIVIIAGYINPTVTEEVDGKTKTIREYHVNIKDKYEKLTKEINQLSQSDKKYTMSEQLKKKREEKEKISKEHIVNIPFIRFSGSIDELNNVFKDYLKQKRGYPLTDFNKNIKELWESIEDNLAKYNRSNVQCDFCKLQVFISSLYSKLYAMNVNTVKVRTVFIPETKNRKWHSKIALKIAADQDKPISALLGSSNLSTGNLPFPDGFLSSYFSFESDIFITTNKDLGLNVSENDFSVIPVNPQFHLFEDILNSIYLGIKEFL